jgi:diguanylate cyclase (GGDEF)-like protein
MGRLDVQKKSAKDKNLIERLNKIISTQAYLAEADFDVHAFMNLVVQKMQTLTPSSGVVIELADEESLIYQAATGSPMKYIGLRFPMENSLSGLCIKSQTILYCQDSETDPRVNKEMCKRVNARSLVVAPLQHNGSAVGVLKILSAEPQAFDKEDIQTLQLMAGLIGSALAHQLFYDTTNKLLKERTKMLDNLRAAETRLQYQANHDYLTNLPNRSYFYDKLLKAMSESRGKRQILALMYLDIDHFKHINDSMGHAFGDALLQAFSLRLKESIGEMDTAARFGGDEFVLLVNCFKDAEIASRIAQAILNKIRESFMLLDKKIDITTSVGFTLFRGENTSADVLLSQADEALYSAKKAGRNTFSIYQVGENQVKEAEKNVGEHA